MKYPPRHLGPSVMVLAFLLFASFFAGLRVVQAQCSTYKGCCVNDCYPAGSCQGAILNDCQVETCGVYVVPPGRCPDAGATETCIPDWEVCVLTFCPGAYSPECGY